MNNATTEQDLPQAKRHWLADNPGILARIAQKAEATPVYVSDIFNGRRPGQSDKGKRIQRELKRAGAPGFSDKAA